jgi:hypothetical protein
MLGTIMENTVVWWWETCEGKERRNERLHPARDNGWCMGDGDEGDVSGAWADAWAG